MKKDAGRSLSDEYIRAELQIAFDQVDRGKVSDLDMDAILAEANCRHAARQQFENLPRTPQNS